MYMIIKEIFQIIMEENTEKYLRQKRESWVSSPYVSYHAYKCNNQILDNHNVPHSIALIFDLISWQSVHYYLGLYL